MNNRQKWALAMIGLALGVLGLMLGLVWLGYKTIIVMFLLLWSNNISERVRNVIENKK